MTTSIPSTAVLTLIGATIRRILEDLEHDDALTADDYDRRDQERDGWTSSVWDGR